MFSNNLSPAEVERLALAAEEMGEAIQVICKILRHGLHNTHPESGVKNQALLEMELGDVLYAIDLLRLSGDVSAARVASGKEAKRIRGRQYLHHQRAAAQDEKGVGDVATNVHTENP